MITTLAGRIGELMRRMLDCPDCALDREACTHHYGYSLHGLAVEALPDGLTSDRSAHTVAVGHRAAALARRLTPSPHAIDLVAASGALHDVGYAFPDTGHHAIDGGRWLRGNGFPVEIVSLVAHHSTAGPEADSRGLSAELAEFPRTDEWKHAVIWAADFTTGPTGGHVTVADRLDEIRSRYGAGSSVARVIDLTEPQMWTTFDEHLGPLGLDAR